MDTGASYVTLPRALAERLGLDLAGAPKVVEEVGSRALRVRGRGIDPLHRKSKVNHAASCSRLQPRAPLDGIPRGLQLRSLEFELGRRRQWR
ncbi:hypothetical protein [Polyangium fumosum]|uniref:hypothetical protein n=1 Tax=Polyangium fumosum TaxID=889272 RepID=UPI003B8356E8